MAKLELNFIKLEELFNIDFTKKIITLKLKENGSLQTSLNTQQLYNWYRHKQREAMWAENMISGSGFLGLQPVITFSNGLIIQIPDVPKFFINGLITTEEEGLFPFIAETHTVLIMSQYSRPHAKLFLSHSSIDKPFVRELRKSLYSICETFFDETDICYGQSITTRLNEELSISDALILILSKNSIESEWVQKEWASMLHMKKTIIVVRIDDVIVPPLLADIKYIDCGDNIQMACDEISVALGNIKI